MNKIDLELQLKNYILTENFNELKNTAVENKQLVKKIQRVIYLLSNNVKLYIGKNGGIYYKTKRSKIYI